MMKMATQIKNENVRETSSLKKTKIIITFYVQCSCPILTRSFCADMVKDHVFCGKKIKQVETIHIRRN